MSVNAIAVLTTHSYWFVPYARTLVRSLRKKGYKARLFYSHKKIPSAYDLLLILSYGRLIEKKFLDQHRHNIVVHASDLPKGTGWAPLFWQILEGKNKIPFVLFEAGERADAGTIYLKDYLALRGDELHDEIRLKEAQKVIAMCLKFLDSFHRLKPRQQKGKRTYYPRRTPKDSELDIHKSIRDQFNLLRIVSNREFPAFFRHKGQKYILHIHRAKGETP